MKIKAFWEFEKPSGWEELRGRLVKSFEFDSFNKAVLFVNEVAKIVEMQNHHPVIKIDYQKVTISTYTHDSDEITEKDLRLADKINDIESENFIKT